MTLEVWFWIFMALWLVLGAFPFFRGGDGRTWPAVGGALFPFLTVLILGWATFGAPVK